MLSPKSKAKISDIAEKYFSNGQNTTEEGLEKFWHQFYGQQILMKKKKIFEKSQNIEKELESINLDKTTSPMIVKFNQ